MTGEAIVDYSNASSTALLDPRTRDWSGPLLEATGIDAGRLPALAAATAPAGTVTSAFAAATGLDTDTVVAVGCGDEMAATLGAGVFQEGEVCDVVGTAEPVCAASTEPRADPTMLVECHPHADPDAWLLENPGFVSGGNLRWWRDHFAPDELARERLGEGDAYDLLVAEAGGVPPGADGLVFLPCMQGAMAPEWIPAPAYSVQPTWEPTAKFEPRRCLREPPASSATAKWTVARLLTTQPFCLSPISDQDWRWHTHWWTVAGFCIWRETLNWKSRIAGCSAACALPAHS